MSLANADAVSSANFPPDPRRTDVATAHVAFVGKRLPPMRIGAK